MLYRIIRIENFIQLSDLRVIICKKCKYCVLPSYIDTHFASKAHKLEQNERRQIADEVAKINRLIGNEETLAQSEFLFPPLTSKPIPALGLPKENALQCTLLIAGELYIYICHMPCQMRAHCIEEHR